MVPKKIANAIKICAPRRAHICFAKDINAFEAQLSFFEAQFELAETP